MADDLLPAVVEPLLRQAQGRTVIIDADLARFFGVTTARLNQAVARNAARFEDYSFTVPMADLDTLMSQDATSSGHGGRRKPVTVFTEHGVVMAATVLRSDRAITASRRIVEAFVAQKRRAVAIPATGAVPDGLLARLRGHMERLMQAEIEASGTSVRDETQAFIRDGLAAIRARLQRSGLENEETEARILKTLAEAEEARARAATEREMTSRQRQKNLANALRLMIEAEMALSGGEMVAFLEVLRDLGRD
ncbi:MAG TPA: ORF6N domain-containing protein [Paracoccaceae bacterium]|nr:ORF6N domain-containing protein [Paracoccaceae bacterium]HMO71461.1 ORF6N domain-containing protein [Paracoccaceae bacterium]